MSEPTRDGLGLGRPRQLLQQRVLAVPTARVQEKPRPQPVAGPEPPRGDRPVVPPRPAEYLAVKGALHERLLNELNERRLFQSGEEALAAAVRDFVARVLNEEELPLNEAERKQLGEDLLEETVGVGPLAPLMADPAVTDILVNGPNMVYIERFGRLEETDVRFRDTEHLMRIIQRIATRVGRRVDESSPMVDARLPDGSRVNATIPPVALDGPTLSIRRFGRQRLRRDDLLRLGMMSPDMALFLEHAVLARKNILISGGTGAGKTTFLGAICEAIPAGERIITIEDAAELIFDQRHVVRLETRPANIEGRGRITTRDLVINSLRMRPDRIIVGEVRGPEALDMLQAMNTGHDGSLTTIHANSPRDALARLETMVLMAGVELPSRAIREQITSAMYLIVHVRRYEDGVRRVQSITEIIGLEGLTPLTNDIFRFERRGKKGKSVLGEFVATGVVPRMVEELRERDVQLPMTLFQKPREGA
ncbi:MAG: CpaF family protein [Gemmataceae bacterium]|nr:CpaF family protein [Gemmataceae bacterium]MDW8264064.1 CpaF family protein [Gemmataceae bacterium]